MTAPRITMPDGKPEFGTVFFVYRAKMHTGSSMHTAGAITAEQHRAIALILQGQATAYDGRADTTRESRLVTPLQRDKLLAVVDEQTARQGHPPEVVRLYRYRDDAALHAARPDMAGLPVTAHAALLARVRLALLARGQAVTIEYGPISA